MYIFNNALKNLGRNKGRNILLGIILFSLILSTTVALVINTTSKEIITDYKTRFGSKVLLGIDFEKLMGETKPNEDGVFNFPTAPEISSEQYLKFANSKYLRSYLLHIETGIAFDKLKAVDEKKNNGSIGSIGGSNSDYVSPTAKLLGYSDANSLPDFQNGMRKIIEGKIYKNKNECLISSEFAQLNNLKVGDEFKIIDSNNSKKEITLKISGIYADATKEYATLSEGTFSLMGSYGNRRNEIFVHIDTITQNFEMSKLSISAEYELKSPENLSSFEKELRSKGLPDAYKVETDKASYDKIVAPVVGLSKVSITFMWLTLIIGGIILLFVTSMTIRERKYEIGVLRAMGMKKNKVMIMLVAETVMITTLCLGIGLIIGNAVSQPVADVLIEGQVKTAKTQNVTGINGSINISSENETTPLSEIKVSLTSEATIQICLTSLLLALLSSMAGVIFITKYEPMKILSERN